MRLRRTLKEKVHTDACQQRSWGLQREGDREERSSRFFLLPAPALPGLVLGQGALPAPGFAHAVPVRMPLSAGLLLVKSSSRYYLFRGPCTRVGTRPAVVQTFTVPLVSQETGGHSPHFTGQQSGSVLVPAHSFFWLYHHRSQWR